MHAVHFTGDTSAVFGGAKEAVETLPVLLYYPLGNISGLFSTLPALLNGHKLIVLDRFSVQGVGGTTSFVTARSAAAPQLPRSR